MSDRADDLWGRLAAVAEASLGQFEDLEQRARVRAQLADGTPEEDWRVRAVVDVDDTGFADPRSLRFLVQIAVPDGWAPLTAAGWRDLGLQWADVQSEALALARFRADTASGG